MLFDNEYGLNARQPIKVLLADDSPLVLAVLRKIITSTNEIKIVGETTRGNEVYRMAQSLKPDVICTDFHMPGMNGYEVTKEIMENNPLPILIISSSVQSIGDELTIFNLLEAGAVDVFPKPIIGTEEEYKKVAEELIQRIKIVSKVRPFRRSSLKPTAQYNKPINQSFINTDTPVRVIAIGASTGGPQLLAQILPNLPASFPLPILCVQHIAEGFINDFVHWLNNSCLLNVKIAEQGEYPVGGTIYFPRENTHLKVDKSGRLLLSKETVIKEHCPSVNELFTSVAQYYTKFALGIILTGMGADGAVGLKNIHDMGGVTVAQDEESCVVFGMPKSAIEIGAVDRILSPRQIIDLLKLLINGKL